MPADVAGQIEVHGYENISDEDDENDELQPSKKKSKMCERQTKVEKIGRHAFSL